MLEVVLVIDREVLCDCAEIEAAVELSLLLSGSFALLDIDGEVEVKVDDKAIESSRSLN